MRVLGISNGFHTIIDDQDYNEISKFKWSAETSRSGGVYAVRAERGKRIKMHRLILNAEKGQEVDHINGDGLDNRRSNLRLATHRQNAMNVPKKDRGRSRFKGVSWRADRGKWRATINVNYKQSYLGLFSDEVSAAKAYNEAAIFHYGKFAHLNPV